MVEEKRNKPKQVRVGPLDNLERIRAEQAKVYRKVRCGVMDMAEAKQYFTMLKEIRESLDLQQEMKDAIHALQTS